MNNKIVFKSPYINRPGKYIHEKCPFDKSDYILNKSTGQLEECGKIPFYERIQSYEQSTLLSYKLRQFNLGDSSALGSPGGSFGDFSGFPRDMQEVLELKNSSERNFYNLPESIRNIFENDFEKFRQSVADGTVERRISEYINSFSAGTGNDGGTSGNPPTEVPGKTN